MSEEEVEHFGTSGDLGYLRQLIAAEGFSSTVVAHDELTRDERRVGYFTFKITGSTEWSLSATSPIRSA
jgi:hypothetical protein